MSLPTRTVKRSTGVVLDVDVIRYLDDLAQSDDRDRSYIINRIVREWAEAKGTSIPVTKAHERRV